MNAQKQMLIAILFLAATGASSRGQSGGGYDLTWSTIDGGGATFSIGGGYELGATSGQPDAQTPPLMSGGPFELTGGFWPAATVCYCLSDMNGDGERNGADIERFVGCILDGGDCSCADVDQADGVTLADVEAFAADLLAGDSCP